MLNTKTRIVLKFILDELVYGGHLISLGAVSIVLMAMIVLNYAITWDILVVTYLITHTVYLFDRFKDVKADLITNPERSNYIKKHYKLIPYILFMFTVSIFLILYCFGSYSGFIFGLFLVIVGILYNIYFKEITSGILGFKNIYVSFVWAMLIIFTALYYTFSLDLTVLFIVVFIFLKMFLTTSFLDIKDIKSDKEKNLLTLPVVFGFKKTLYFLNFLNFFIVALIITGIFLKIVPSFMIMLCFSSLYVYYFLNKLGNRKPDKFFHILISGEKILWSILIILGKFFV